MEPHAQVRSVGYIDKSRRYYAAHGYDEPYRWVTNEEAPFARLTKGLSEMTIAVVTTAFPVGADGKPKLPMRSFAAASSPVPEQLFTKDLSWDQDATHTDDVGSFLPLAALEQLATSGRIGTVAKRFYGVPTSYSQRKTLKDAARVLDWCTEDAVDAVLLVGL
ncbi:MAG: hypothetical protein V3V01_13615 [Acidimicrobiales bacterium]